MGLRLKNQDLGECFFITNSFRDHNPWGNMRGVYEILVKAIAYQLNETQSKLVAYVLMPSHLHAILFINGKSLSNFIRDFKKFTSQKALFDICGTQLIWQQRYDRQVIISDKVLSTKINYIHQNPVKAGLVKESKDWKWSSAGDYIDGRKGPLDVWMEWNR
jgi:putative transposase